MFIRAIPYLAFIVSSVFGVKCRQSREGNSMTGRTEGKRQGSQNEAARVQSRPMMVIAGKGETVIKGFS